jgi:diamine N-acetyltransferase
VSLREITDDNRAAVEALAVSDEQDDYVASVTVSLADAVEYPEAMAWYRAIYADDEPVGFVMISDGITSDDPTLLGPYYLWRLLVDRRHQGKGYGSSAIDLVVDHLHGRPDADELLVSCHVGPATPIPFYERYGFVRTGQVHEGEPVLALPLPPTPPATRRTRST